MPLAIGVTAGGVLIPVQVDANGVVIVDQVSALPAGTNNIGDVDVLTLPALPIGTNEIGKIQARNYGLVGGSFQKDPIRFGYSGVVHRAWSNLSLAAGTNNVNDSNVPGGEIWIITNVSVRYNGTVPTSISHRIYDGATTLYVWEVVSPTDNVLYDRQGYWVLEPGDSLRFTVYGATLNDDLRCYALGHRVDIDQ